MIKIVKKYFKNLKSKSDKRINFNAKSANEWDMLYLDARIIPRNFETMDAAMLAKSKTKFRSFLGIDEESVA